MSYRAYLAFQNHGILPQDYINLSPQVQAFIYAGDVYKAEQMEEAQKRLRR